VPKENEVTQAIEERNKAFVLEAFETLFNKRDNLSCPGKSSRKPVATRAGLVATRAFKIVGGVEVVGVGSGFTGRGLAWCRSWCGG
jgi:hypothetical protein